MRNIETFKKFKLFESVQTNINSVNDKINLSIQNCKDILIELEDVGFSLDVKKFVNIIEKTFYVKFIIYRDISYGVKIWKNQNFNNIFGTLTDYLNSEGMITSNIEKVLKREGNHFYYLKFEYCLKDLNNDYVNHIRHCLKYNLVKLFDDLVDITNIK